MLSMAASWLMSQGERGSAGLSGLEVIAGGGGGKLSSSNYSSLVPIQYALHLTLPLSNYVF